MEEETKSTETETTDTVTTPLEAPGDVLPEDPGQEAPQANNPVMMDPGDIIRAFDVTAGERKLAMERVEKVLEKSAKGGKIDRKDIARALSGLKSVSERLDSLIQSILSDIIMAVRAIGNMEANTFRITANVLSVVEALKAKGLITDEELAKAQKEKVLPILMQGMQQPVAEEPAVQEPTKDSE